MKNPGPCCPAAAREGGLRSGTEATAQIAGFAKAVELRAEGLEDKLRHMAEIKAYAQGAPELHPGPVFVGRSDAPPILSRLPGGLAQPEHRQRPGQPGHLHLRRLRLPSGKPSRVVAAASAQKTAGSVVRLSFGPETTREEIDACVQPSSATHDTRMPML